MNRSPRYDRENEMETLTLTAGKQPRGTIVLIMHNRVTLRRDIQAMRREHVRMNKILRDKRSWP